MTNYKINTFEATALFVNLICNKFFLFSPEYFRAASNSGSGLMIVVMFILMFLVWSFYTRRNFKNASFGKIGSIFLIILFIVSIALTLRQYTETVKVISLAESSLYFIEGIFITAMITGAYFGLKGICKAHTFFIPGIFTIMLVLILCASKSLDFYMLTPVLGNGSGSIVSEGFFLLSTFLEFTLFFLIKPYMNDEKSFKRAGNLTLLFSFLIILTITLGYIASFSENASTEKYPPVFQIIRLIDSGTYFQRFDSLFLIAFSLSAYLYLGAMLFFVWLLFKSAFDIESKTPIVMPFAFVIISVSFINVLSDAVTDSFKTVNMFLWAIPVLFPILSIRKGKKVQ